MGNRDVFQAEDIVLTDKGRGQLVQEVASLPTGLGMKASQFSPGFMLVLRTLLFSR